MPREIVHYADLRLIHRTYPSPDEIVQQDPARDFEADFCWAATEGVRLILNDMRGINSTTVEPSGMRDVIGELGRHAEIASMCRWAVVCDDSRTTGLVMFLKQIAEPYARVEVFSTLEAALEWLGIPTTRWSELTVEPTTAPAH